MKSRKEIILELTPLLDVILIMMFYILMQNSLASEKERQDAAEQIDKAQQSAQSMIEEVKESAALENASLSASLESAVSAEDELEDKLAVLNAQLEGQQEFSQYAVITSITVVSDSSGGRKLHVICGDEDNSFPYDWDNMKYAENALADALEKVADKASEQRPVFLVFSYDDEKIYRRDFEMVQNVLEKTLTGTEHIYLKYSGGHENGKEQ